MRPAPRRRGAGIRITVDPLRFYASADRHGIDRADAAHVARHPCTVVLLDDDPVKELRVGFDRHARALEVVVLEVRGAPVLIHAMRLRPGYHHLLEE